MMYPDNVGRILSVLNTDCYSAWQACGVNAFSSGAWPANNRAIYVPVTLDDPMLVTKVYSANGSAVSSNIDIGCHGPLPSLARIFSVGGTGQSGTSTIQTFTLTNPALLLPGNYLMSIALSSTGGAVTRGTASSLPVTNSVRILQQATAYPLPDPAVPVAVTSDYFPLFGFIGI